MRSGFNEILTFMNSPSVDVITASLRLRCMYSDASGSSHNFSKSVASYDFKKRPESFFPACKSLIILGSIEFRQAISLSLKGFCFDAFNASLAAFWAFVTAWLAAAKSFDMALSCRPDSILSFWDNIKIRQHPSHQSKGCL